MPELIIGDHNKDQYAAPPVIDGEQKSTGLVPRDWNKYPAGFYSTSRKVDFKPLDRSVWSEVARDQIATQSRLSDIRNRGMFGKPIPALDQNGKGYCWIHSGCSALLLLRAKANMPYADLSAYAGACIIKNYRDEGGWGAQGLDWICEHGLPEAKFWPQRSMSKSNDTPEMRANAKLYRVTEGWWDADVKQYDRMLSFEQQVTFNLLGIPTINDRSHWSHSTCGCDAVDGETQRTVSRNPDTGKLWSLQEFDLVWGMNDPVTGGWGIRDFNSWGASWGDNGMGVLTGSQAPANGGCTAPAVALPL